MMRYLLALLLFGICCFVGFAKAKSLKRRLDVVESFLLDIKQLSILMQYKRTPIASLVKDLDGSALSPFWEAFLARLTRGGPIADAWKATLDHMREGDGDFFYLADEETRVLHDFGDSLGTSDFTAQKANIEMALARLTVQAETLKREASQKGKIYRSLGMLGGLAAAIIVW